MIVRNIREAARSDRRVVTDNWESIRLVLGADNAGFSFHVTTMFAGTETTMWYRHHVECVYCTGGDGELISLSDGTSHPLAAGSLYLLDKHDRHTIRAATDLKMICVFAPPLHGREVHAPDGSYPSQHEIAELQSG
jgi:L-ectoine synthase